MSACLAHASAESFGSGKAFTGRSDWRVRLLASSGLARRLLGTDCGLPVCGVSARGSLRRVGPRAVHLVRRLNLLPPGLVLLLRWPWCPRPWPPSALRRLGVGGWCWVVGGLGGRATVEISNCNLFSSVEGRWGAAMGGAVAVAMVVMGRGMGGGWGGVLRGQALRKHRRGHDGVI